MREIKKHPEVLVERSIDVHAVQGCWVSSPDAMAGPGQPASIAAPAPPCWLGIDMSTGADEP
jgi:hypothetical protein